MKSFEEVLRSPASIDEARFTTASADTGALGREMITLDDSELPPPVSFSDHVARLTASRKSLIPPKPLWPFGLRAHPHRQAS